MPSSDANEVNGAKVPLVRITERTPTLMSENACMTQRKTGNDQNYYIMSYIISSGFAMAPPTPLIYTVPDQ